MASQPAIQRNEIEQILGAQPGAQMPFAQYILNHGPLQGSVINVVARGQRALDRLRPRGQTRRALPQQVAGFVNREKEQRLVGEALAQGQVVDVHGPAGCGKTSLLSQVLHGPSAGGYPDGIVYLTVGHDTAEDLLQELVEHFYESEERPVKVTEKEAGWLMAGRRVLIVLDEADGLTAGDVDAIARAFPQAGLVISGHERRVRRGQWVSLGALPGEAALALFEQHLGRALGGEWPAAEAICRALGGMPLAIAGAARAARLRRVPLAQVLQEVQPQTPEPRPMEQLFWMLSQHLSAGERQVLAAAAAAGGSSAGRAALAHISAVAPARLEEHLLRLEELGLLHATGDRWRLDDGLQRHLRHVLGGIADDMLARAAGYYLQQAGTLRVRFRHPDEANVIAALSYYRERGRWREVLKIIRNMETYLVTSARWGQWRRLLEDAWQAGRELRDPRTEAWAQNQLGIFALAAGDVRKAVRLFRGALRLWRAIDDQTGAAIAHWNLQTLLGPPPQAEGDPKPPAAPIRRGAARTLARIRSTIATILPALVAALLIILVTLFSRQDNRAIAPATVLATTVVVPTPAVDAGARLDRDLSPLATVVAPPAATVALSPTMNAQGSPTAAAPLSPIATPSPQAVLTASAPPAIAVWLVEGCDHLYSPGELVEFRAQANLTGTVDLYIRGPTGQRQHLLRVELQAGGLTRGRYSIPQGAGSWRLEAELDGGRAAAACSFAVAPRTETLGDHPKIPA